MIIAKLKYHVNFRTGNRVELVNTLTRRGAVINGRHYLAESLMIFDQSTGVFVDGKQYCRKQA